MQKITRKKVDLLKFQQMLNEQFLEIFTQKNQENMNQTISSDMLGLVASHDDVQFFLPLKDLKSISLQNEYENSVRTKSWILGFNQDRGDIYTIFNFPKVIDLLLHNKTDFNKAELTSDSRIVYMKSQDNEHNALLLPTLKLEYTAEFTPLFNHHLKEDVFSWSFAEQIDFETFVKKENMSLNEWNLLNKIHQNILLGESFVQNKYESAALSDRHLLVGLMVKSVYLDAFGARPIFILNIQNLTKFLIGVSPF